MKKSTKSEKPAAPQVKPVAKKSVESSPVKKTVVAPKKVATPKKAAPATAVSAPALAVASLTPVATTTPVTAGTTTIVAKVDVGFGNNLFIRGEGPGLSWDRGVLMTCSADDQWTFSISGATRPVVFKFLLNDMTWSGGEDFSVDAGSTVVLSPAF
jgi:hypothetical protein